MYDALYTVYKILYTVCWRPAIYIVTPRRDPAWGQAPAAYRWRGPIRCSCWLTNPSIRNQTLATPDFLRDTRPGHRFLKGPRPDPAAPAPKNEKCHKTGLNGSDFDENWCGRRYFSWRIFLGGSRLDPAKLTIWKNKKFSGDTRAPPRFLKIARPFKKFG